MAAIVHRQTNPDGTVTVYYDDGTSQRYGEARDPVEIGRQAGAAAAAQTAAQYGDPWYTENVLGPMNQMSAASAKENAQKLQMQAQQLAMQGRSTEAAIANQKAQIELRKAELRQQAYFKERDQMMTANLALANMRGPGNAAQFIDAGRRLGSMGIQSTALADIARGGTPQGAFAPGGAAKPVSLQDRMSGMLGASSSDAINQRDANDRALASQISSRAGHLQRGSLESLSPYERSYVSSYSEAEGFDWDSVTDAYRRAGIMQGRG